MEQKDTVAVHNKTFRLIIPPAEIERKLQEGAKWLATKKLDHPLFIIVLDGAFMFGADFIRQFNTPVEMQFIKYTSYDGTESKGEIHEKIGLTNAVNNRHVVILEDIIDTGLTVKHLSNVLQPYNLKSLTIITLLQKPSKLKHEINVDYACFTITDEFVIGYGLDLDGIGRNLNGIYQLAD